MSSPSIKKPDSGYHILEQGPNTNISPEKVKATDAAEKVKSTAASHIKIKDFKIYESKPLNERISWLNKVKADSFVPNRTWRSGFLYVCTFCIYYAYVCCKDKSRIEEGLKTKRIAMEQCAEQIASDPKLDLNDQDLTKSLKSLNSEFKQLIFNEAVNKKNQLLIKKCWEIIPCDPEQIQAFLNVLKNAGVDSSLCGDKTPLELLLLQTNLDQHEVLRALNALYGEKWKDDKSIALTILEKHPIIASQIYPQLANDAVKIQRAFRRHQLKKKIKIIDPLKVEQQKEIKYSIPINKRVRQPLENLEKHTDWIPTDNKPFSQAQKAITKATKLGSYDKFELAVKASFSDTLQSIYASPPDQRKYVIIADDAGKSTNWVTAHLHELMSVHPPTDIVSRENLANFLQENPEVKHIVMVDDGTYSGEQAAYYIKKMEGLSKDHMFHVTIPYMTAYGKDKLVKTLKRKHYAYQMHDRQVMHSYQELVDLGHIFSFTGKVLVNKEKLSNIAELSNEEALPNKIEINLKLLELKNMAISEADEKKVYKKILETISFINNHCKINDSKILSGDRELSNKEERELIRQLFQCMKSEHSQQQHDELLSAYTYTTMTMEESQKATWFAHKGVDYISTNQEEMGNIAGNIPAEPYKDSLVVVSRRKEQINNIKERMGNSKLEDTVINQGYLWLKDRVDFVHTNRGFFLIGNSYLEETSASPIILHINGKRIELGGKEGEYQYKLKKGDVFELEDPEIEDPETHVKIKLRLDDSGKLLAV